MSVARPRLLRILHICVLGLLMLGVAMKPVLGSLCETHALSHALLAHGYHEHQADQNHESLASREMDQAHASGGHWLLHEGDHGGTYADIIVAITLPTAPHGPTHVGMPPAVPVPQQRPLGPFRPPIA